MIEVTHQSKNTKDLIAKELEKYAVQIEGINNTECSTLSN